MNVPEPDTSRRTHSSTDELIDRFLQALDSGELAGPEEWFERHPGRAAELREIWEDWQTAARALDAASGSPGGLPGVQHNAGDHVGEYRLVRLLGRGGQGTVWEAEQESLGRRVALKLIRPDRVTSQALALLEREARAGGRLAHPGIVAVHAWGESEGVHWIAQELVPGGRTFFDWIEEQRKRPELDAEHYRQVAEWIAELADALGIAHDAGIIHRDVKPLNVLLTAEGRPKLTDFGLARVSGDSELSVSGDVRGTYCYMSPEQIEARRGALDARTDVFSLGVVMYELLSLRRPFEGDTSHQIAHKIVSEEATDLRELRSRLPEELAVICGKALEKDRALRYADMREFAADVRRWLVDEPILAKPPSPWRRAQKWMRRHPTRAVALSMASVGALLVGGLVVRLYETIEELEWSKSQEEVRSGELGKERERLSQANSALSLEVETVSLMRGYLSLMIAEGPPSLRSMTIPDLIERTLEDHGVSAEDSRGVVDALRIELARAEVARSEQHGKGADFSGPSLSERQEETNLSDISLLGQALAGLVDQMHESPRIEAALRLAFGRAFEALGLLEPALEELERAYALYTGVHGAEHADSLSVLGGIGAMLYGLGRLNEAEPVLEEALEGFVQLADDRSRESLEVRLKLAIISRNRGMVQEAESELSGIVSDASEALGEADQLTLRAMARLGVVQAQEGVGDGGRSLRRAAELAEERLGLEHEVTQIAWNALGVLHLNRGEFEEAVAPLRKSLESFRATRGDLHRSTFTQLDNLGNALKGIGEFEEAEALLREAHSGRKKALGRGHRMTQISANNLGTFLLQRGRREEALPILEEAFVFGADLEKPVRTDLYARLAYGMALFHSGEREGAWAVIEPAPELFEEVLGGRPESLSCCANAANVAEHVGEYERGAEFAGRAIKLDAELGGFLTPTMRSGLWLQAARCLVHLERFDEALVVSSESARYAREALVEAPEVLAVASIANASLLLIRGEHEGAAAELRALSEVVEVPDDLSELQAKQVADMRQQLKAAGVELGDD